MHEPAVVPSRPAVQSRTRVALATIFFCNGFGMASWFVHVPLVKAHLGLDDRALGLALFSTGLGAFATLWLSGWFLTRFGSRRVVIVSSLIFALSLLGPAFAPSYALLVVCLFILGAATGLMDVSMNGQAAYYEQQIGRPVMSSLHATWSVGVWCGSLIGALFLAGPESYHLTLMTVLLIGALWTTYRYLQRTRGKAGGSVLSLPHGILIVFGLLCLVSMLAEGSVADWAGVHLRDTYHVSNAISAFGYSAFAFSMFIARVAGDRLVMRFGREFIVRLGSAIGAVGMALAAFGGNWLLAVIGFALTGFGVANVVPVLFSLSAARRPDAIEQATSSVFATGYLGFLLGPSLIGFLANQFGLPMALGVIAVSLGLIVVGTPGRK